jgi:5'-3' exonuclease
MNINYMTGLAWNFLYYKKGTWAVNAQYLYETFHSPLFTDLSIVINSYRGNFLSPYIATDDNVMFGIPEQLLAVLPPTSQNLLPIELQPLMNSNSPITDMFPTNFIVENDGKNDTNHSLVILPPVEAERLSSVVKLVRWSPERASLYTQDKNIIQIREMSENEKISSIQRTKYTERPSQRPQFSQRPSQPQPSQPQPSQPQTSQRPSQRPSQPQPSQAGRGRVLGKRDDETALPAWAKTFRY